MSDTCKTCRFWREDRRERDPNDDETWGFGQCRRQPPRLIEPYVAARMPRPEYGAQIEPEMGTVDLQVCSLWPATFVSDWCGEYEREGGEVPL